MIRRQRHGAADPMLLLIVLVMVVLGAFLVRAIFVKHQMHAAGQATGEANDPSQVLMLQELEERREELAARDRDIREREAAMERRQEVWQTEIDRMRAEIARLQAELDAARDVEGQPPVEEDFTGIDEAAIDAMDTAAEAPPVDR